MHPTLRSKNLYVSQNENHSRHCGENIKMYEADCECRTFVEKNRQATRAQT